MTGSYIRNLRVSGCCCKMNTSNRFDPLYNGYISLSERDPGSSSDREIQTASHMEIDCSFDWFSRSLEDCSLPGEPHAAGPFDNRVDFELGDPGANFEGNNKCEYATSGEVGEPHWPQLFQYLLSHFEHVRLLSTVFVLVDNRDLTAPKTEQESLAHWPTVEAWWHYMDLPVNCVTSSLFLLIRQLVLNMSTLHGLAHLCWLPWSFCFQVFTLCYSTVTVCLSPCLKLPTCGRRYHSCKMGSPGLLPVALRTLILQVLRKVLPRLPSFHVIVGITKSLAKGHNAEINAGFIVAFASCHKTAVQEDRWERISDACRSPQNLALIQNEANRLANLYWDYVSDFLDTRKPLNEIGVTECAAWVQSGLALAPFAGCVTKYTCDWTIAWSLIESGLPKKSSCLRLVTGLAMDTQEELARRLCYRSPPMLTWARACFEQGSLPSTLHLSGEALLCVLPGDRMFQAQRLVPGCARPVILHGYGGAKRDIPKTLPTIASDGWVPFAHAMVGYLHVVGASCDFRIQPDPLTHREQLLLLSMWRRTRVPCLPNQCALRTWLAHKLDIPISHDPDHGKSPHAVDKAVQFEPLFKSLAMQAAASGSMICDELAPTKEQLLALRMVAYGLSTDHLELLTSLLLGGTMTFNFLHDHWTAPVQDYLDGKPLLEVHTVQSFVDMVNLLPPGRQSIVLIDKQGKQLADRAVTSLRFEGGNGVELPVDMYIVHESAPDRGLPDVIRIDCTGVGGDDLGSGAVACLSPI